MQKWFEKFRKFWWKTYALEHFSSKIVDGFKGTTMRNAYYNRGVLAD